jgi:putative ABC transport system permease protein
MREEIDRQAASLLGADLEISGNREPSDTIIKKLESQSSEHSEERRFTSMIYFPKSGDSRLGQVRALQGDYPYYGDLETLPVEASRTFRKARGALVDQTLMIQ